MTQTDIEIYIKDANFKLITQWLTDRLGDCTPWQQKGKVSKCEILQKNINITWYEKAAGSWHCLYIASSKTPWMDDLSCAQDANSYLNVEIRCAQNGWSEAESDATTAENVWLKIVDQTVSQIIWNT